MPNIALDNRVQQSIIIASSGPPLCEAHSSPTITEVCFLLPPKETFPVHTTHHPSSWSLFKPFKHVQFQYLRESQDPISPRKWWEGGFSLPTYTIFILISHQATVLYLVGKKIENKNVIQSDTRSVWNIHGGVGVRYKSIFGQFKHETMPRMPRVPRIDHRH